LFLPLADAASGRREPGRVQFLKIVAARHELMLVERASHRLQVTFPHHIVSIAKEEGRAERGTGAGVPRVGRAPSSRGIDDPQRGKAIAEAVRDGDGVVARSVVGDHGFPRIASRLPGQCRQLFTKRRRAVVARDNDAESRRRS
jgi:hypothetical protein